MAWVEYVPRKGLVKVTEEEMRKLMGLTADEAGQKHDTEVRAPGKPEKGKEERSEG